MQYTSERIGYVLAEAPWDGAWYRREDADNFVKRYGGIVIPIRLHPQEAIAASFLESLDNGLHQACDTKIYEPRMDYRKRIIAIDRTKIKF